MSAEAWSGMPTYAVQPKGSACFARAKAQGVYTVKAPSFVGMDDDSQEVWTIRDQGLENFVDCYIQNML